MSLRSAATLLVARDASQLEVLVIERPEKMRFAPGAHVFPGGVLDSDDDELVRRLSDRCDGWSDEEASENLGVSTGGLAFWVAAVRECFEEVGLLFARHKKDGETVNLARPGLRERFEGHRQELCGGRLTFAELVVA
ncbi:MAG: NUDIX domain-containing protein, partial [Acidimicrobiia bacterium]